MRRQREICYQFPAAECKAPERGGVRGCRKPTPLITNNNKMELTDDIWDSGAGIHTALDPTCEPRLCHKVKWNSRPIFRFEVKLQHIVVTPSGVLWLICDPDFVRGYCWLFITYRGSSTADRRVEIWAATISFSPHNLLSTDYIKLSITLIPH